MGEAIASTADSTVESSDSQGTCNGRQSARPSPLAGRSSQKGVALIAALFLLVALAALAVYMVTISGVQQQTPTLAADASRAWYAARSGIELVAHEATQSPAGCPGGPPPSSSSYTLDGFNVVVSCDSSDHEERGSDLKVFVLEAKASRGTYGGLNFVSRTARATVTVTTAP